MRERSSADITGFVLAALLVSGARLQATDRGVIDWFHFRLADEGLAELLVEGASRSPVFEALVARLEQSRLVAYIECASVLKEAGQLQFVEAAGAVRYVRIKLDCRAARPSVICLLAHELQHAVEVADEPGVVDQASMEQFYRRVGIDTGPGLHFETRSAMRAGWAVFFHLRNKRWGVRR
jgi:hypothetical protein